jgi:hypothetical protein
MEQFPVLNDLPSLYLRHQNFCYHQLIQGLSLIEDVPSAVEILIRTCNFLDKYEEDKI